MFKWGRTGPATVLGTWSTTPEFEVVWPLIAEQVASGTPANHLELFWVTTGNGVAVGDDVTIDLPSRPGVYLFPDTLLVNVPTSKNNRGTTLKAETIAELMRSAIHLDLWAPLPMWFAGYAPPRPPDLYLALRGEFDRRFSPAS